MIGRVENGRRMDCSAGMSYLRNQIQIQNENYDRTVKTVSLCRTAGPKVALNCIESCSNMTPTLKNRTFCNIEYKFTDALHGETVFTTLS